MNFIDQLVNEHGSAVQEQLTSRLGLTPQQASAALPGVASLILGGLKKQATTHGPQAAEASVQSFGAVDLTDLGSLLGGGQADTSAIFGSRNQQAAQALGAKLGIPAAAAGKLIAMLAPLVIGMLMKKGQGGGASSGQPGGGGLISILDRDGDGSIMDDLGGMLGGANKAGCLSAILGGLLKGKR